MLDERIGRLAAVFANCHRDRKKAPEPFQAADFYPDVPREEARRTSMSGDEITKVLTEIASNGKQAR